MKKQVMRPLTEEEMKSITGGGIFDWFVKAFNCVKSHFVHESVADTSWESTCSNGNHKTTYGGVAIGF